MPGPSRSKSRPGAGSAVVREMSLSDLPAVFALGERLFPADKWPALYRTWDEYELAVHFASDGETCLVADLGGEVVGFALGTVLAKRGSAWSYGYLLWLGVAGDIARKGIAARLYERMTELFIALGARMILVDTDADNEAALSFFRKQGFGQETPHLFLSRNLSRDPDYLRHRDGPPPPKGGKAAPPRRPRTQAGKG